MSDLKLSLYFLVLSILFIVTVKADPKDDELPSADFLNFLSEVEDATGDGFETWLETDTTADSDINNERN